MPYVKRSTTGEIASLHREPEPGAEALPSDHPEVLAFLDRDSRDLAFASMDAGLIRVLEDLVDVLIARNVINITDLPAEAQGKLFDRRHFRDRFRRNALNLFGDQAMPNYAAAAKQPDAQQGVGAPVPNSLRLL